jgi:hypothetical protein
MCEALRCELYKMEQAGETSEENKTNCFAQIDLHFAKSCKLFGV